MIPDDTDVKDITPEQIKQVASDVSMFAHANKITRKAIATEIGWGASSVSEFLHGTYGGKSAQLAKDLDGWLNETEQRMANHETTKFVWTNVAQYIDGVATYCREKKKIGLIFGPETAGLGKTTALRAIAQKLTERGATFITVKKSDANPTGLLKKILQGMHLQDSGSNSQRMDRVINALRGRSHLLIIDQIHNLRDATGDKPMYYLTDIYDATEVAQLWCGTADIYAYLMRRAAKTTDEPLAQIRSRIYPCVDLLNVFGQDGKGGGEPLCTVEQVREMFSKFKLKLTPSAARWLCRLIHAKGSGALRTCVQIMEYASFLGVASNKSSIDVDQLKDALRQGVTSSRAAQMIGDVEQPAESSPAQAMAG